MNKIRCFFIPLDLITEIESLVIINGEDLRDFHNSVIAFSNHLGLSRMMVPPNLFFGRYLKQINRCEGINTHLSPFNRQLAYHLLTLGDHVPFKNTIADVYRHLVDSKCSTTAFLQTTDSLEIVPSAHFGSHPR